MVDRAGIEPASTGCGPVFLTVELTVQLPNKGASGWDLTNDLLITNEVLLTLSYKCIINGRL